jgi:hypothetical protein
VVKPRPLRPAARGGFTLHNFIIDERAGAVTCSTGTPGDEPATDGDLRRAVRGLPATAALPRRRRLVGERPPAQAAAARRPAPLTGFWQGSSRNTLGATDGV